MSVHGGNPSRKSGCFQSTEWKTHWKLNGSDITHIHIICVIVFLSKFRSVPTKNLYQSLDQLVHQQLLLDPGQLEEGTGVLDYHGPQSVHHGCREPLDRAHPVDHKKTDGQTNWITV